MSQREYRTILKTSAISGAARIVTILASFLRAKLVAIYAGPAGMGILGLYTSSLGVVSSVASLGIDASGVRQIAANAKDPEQISRTTLALRRLCWVTGALAAVICVTCAGWISEMTFGDRSHEMEIMMLAAAVFMGQVSLGQSALLRGLRQIRQIAIQSVVTAVLSLLGALTCLMVWREEGIVPMMLSASAMALVGTWWYARQVRIHVTKQLVGETLTIAKPLVTLGLAFMASGLAAALGTHLIGIILHDVGGAIANGWYQAAWAVSGSLASLILTGMSQDFYPRLTEVAHDHVESTAVIYRQMEVGMLMSLPPLCLLSVLATFIIPILFSHDFTPAAEAIPWLVIGCFGRAVSWPMAYLLLAKGMGRLFLASEIMAVALHVALAYVLATKLGLIGAAIAFAALYLVYSLGMGIILQHITSIRHRPLLGAMALAGYCILVSLIWLPIAAGIVVSLSMVVVCLYRLRHLSGLSLGLRAK